ncbi:hypothetical protein MCP1_640005 [Candidatus Terasakiella magnetica]|nr:hypothetical protein MCP1_640005 [Candidatus Terasakiella magnetica]
MEQAALHPGLEIRLPTRSAPQAAARGRCLICGNEGSSSGAIGAAIGTGKGGYPILEHIRPIVWAPGLSGAVVISLWGGDFELVAGRDFSIGYLDHDVPVEQRGGK